MESWLMAVDGVGKHAGSWSYIQESIRNRENEGKKNNLGWMLYSEYAVLGECWTRCQLMIIAWRDREGWLNFVFCDVGRVMDDNNRDRGWRWEQSGGYDQIWEIRGTTSLIGLGRSRIGFITGWIGTHTCHIRDAWLTRTRNSHKSQFLIAIYPISPCLSHSRPQLYHHIRTPS